MGAGRAGTAAGTRPFHVSGGGLQEKRHPTSTYSFVLVYMYRLSSVTSPASVDP